MGITTNGKNLILKQLFTTTAGTGINSMGVGTDGTAFAVGNTKVNNPGLSAATNEFLQALDAGAAGTSVTGAVATLTSTFATGVANFAWNEIALFNGTVNGTSVMFDRIVIGPFTKSSAVSIVAVITVTQA